MQHLDIISVNLWQMLVSLANLVLLFCLVKKFLYKPVKNMLKARQKAIEDDYTAASEAKEQALAEKQAYDAKIQGAKREADALIKNAVEIAHDRERDIVDEAKRKAEGIVRQAENDAALALSKAQDGIKREIVEVSSLLTSKLLEREMSADDHRHFVESFIESIGDNDDRT